MVLLALNTAVLGQVVSGMGGTTPRKADSTLVEDMSEEFKKYLSNDPLRAEQIGIEALELAKAIKYQKGILKITNNLGVLYSGMGDYTRALELLPHQS